MQTLSEKTCFSNETIRDRLTEPVIPFTTLESVQVRLELVLQTLLLLAINVASRFIV